LDSGVDLHPLFRVHLGARELLQKFIGESLISSHLFLHLLFGCQFLLCFNPDPPSSYIAVDVVVDIFFLCDIVVNFRTGYFPNFDRPDLVIMNPSKVIVF
jgi:hypothetical protein